MSSQSPGIGSALPDMNVNTSAMVLTNDGVAASWEDAASAGLPPQSTHSGQYLTTNGTAASWAVVTADSLLPSQSAKSGYFLSTNGTTVSWSLSLTALLPTQTGHSGEVLSTDGAGTLSWVSATGLSLGAFSSTPSTDGLTLAGGTLNLDPADGTHAGGVSATTQTFGGVKTFGSVPVASGLDAPTTTALTLSGHTTDGASAVSIHLNAATTLTNAGSIVASVENNGTPYFDFRTTGAFVGAKPGALFAIGRDPGDTFGGCMWLGVLYSSATGANYSVMSDGSNTIMNAPAGSFYWRFGGAGGGPSMSSTSLDLSGLGTSGSIELKNEAGVTKTITIVGTSINIA